MAAVEAVSRGALGVCCRPYGAVHEPRHAPAQLASFTAWSARRHLMPTTPPDLLHRPP